MSVFVRSENSPDAAVQGSFDRAKNPVLGFGGRIESHNLMKLIFAAIALLMLSGCVTVHTWNQRLTVIVDTPAGQVSGFSIVTVTDRKSNGPFTLPESRGVRTEVRGDGVVVALPNGAYLFVLLKGQDDLAYYTFQDVIPYESGGGYDRWVRQIARHREPGIVPPDHYPMMVTFDDISDPKTVREVDPKALSATFGEGYAIVEMQLEITEEAPEYGEVDRVLPWLEELGTSYLNGRNIGIFDPENPLLGQLGASSFRTRINR